jgi:hypothetical protein
MTRFLPYIFHFLLLGIISSSLSAQNKNDNIWLLGYPPNDSVHHFGGTKIDFSSTPAHISFYHLPPGELLLNSAIVCNDTGKLQFYSNGCKIFNSLNQVIKNSDSLNVTPGYFFDEWCIMDNFYDARQGMMALPWPGKPGQYALFHLALSSYDHDATVVLDHFFFTHVDMNANNGLGMVREKNSLLLLDPTFQDNLTAVRHGNGRDWWLVLPTRKSDIMYLLLFTPEGIKGPFSQHSGFLSDDYLYNIGQATFSPDGSKYIRANHLEGINIFDFDRCQGTFSKLVHLAYPGDPSYTDGHCSGAAVSSNSRYLYISTCYELFQYDLLANEIESTKQRIDVLDGFVDEYHTASRFYQQMLAPDGKIYMSAPNGIYYENVIEHPDSAGIKCDFRQHELVLPSRFGFTLPNFPHFRLQNLPGSPCDSLVVHPPPPPPPSDSCDLKLTPNGNMRIVPNPVNGNSALVAIPSCEGGLLRVYATSGVLLGEYAVGAKSTYSLNCTDWPSAMYFVTFIPSGGRKAISSKMVIARRQ